MNIYTEEYHGYFTLELGYYQGNGFDSTELRDLRFALLLLYAEQGEFVLEGRKILFYGQMLLCMNEQESLYVSENVQVKGIIFHPSVINGAFDFDNIRTQSESFDITQQQDHYFLMAFMRREKENDAILFPSLDAIERIAFLMECFQEQITKQDNNHWACKSRSFLIESLSICSTLTEEKTIPCENEQDAQEKEMQRIVAYLKSNVSKKITIAELTKEFQMNRTDLSKRFLEYTGETVMEYMTRIRIEFAATMLRDTKIPLIDIMERVGFRDYSYFSNTFKKKKGISPQAYRKKYCWM